MTCEKFTACNPSLIAEWIGRIPFEDWPQQLPLADGKIRPAMVTDLTWHDFRATTEALVNKLAWLCGGKASNRMLSVVMPGASIGTHADAMNPPWLTRAHVPLVTNTDAGFVIGGVWHHMEVGSAYRVDIRCQHEVRNEGKTPRIHLMFDVLGG